MDQFMWPYVVGSGLGLSTGLGLCFGLGLEPVLGLGIGAGLGTCPSQELYPRYVGVYERRQCPRCHLVSSGWEIRGHGGVVQRRNVVTW